MTKSATSVTDIAATPAVMNLTVNEEKTISVKGLKGGMYAPVELDNADCTFATEAAGTATVETTGVVKGVTAGETYVTVTYGEHTDVVKVKVTEA